MQVQGIHGKMGLNQISSKASFPIATGSLVHPIISTATSTVKIQEHGSGSFRAV